MDIFLIRHAPATDAAERRYPNDDRPLTKDGVQRMAQVSAALAGLLPKKCRILASPLKRSRHSAEILLHSCRIKSKVEIFPAMTPNAGLNRLLGTVRTELGKSRPQALIIVGHEPFLSKFFERLIGADSGKSFFKKAGCACITLEKVGKSRRLNGTLRWMVTPRVIRKLRTQK